MYKMDLYENYNGNHHENYQVKQDAVKYYMYVIDIFVYELSRAMLLGAVF